MASGITKQESLSVMGKVGADGLDLKKAQSTVIHQELKKATEYGLTQSITKWLLVEENEKLLSSKFICIRWSQTKGFIVLKKYNQSNKNKDAILAPSSPSADKKDFLLYVDLLGANNQDNDINEWLMNTFTLNTKSIKAKAKDNNKEKDDEKKNDDNVKKEHHNIITLKALYDILKTNWGDENIKVSDRKSVAGVIEFRIVASKKKMNSFYQSLDDLFHLLESDDEDQNRHVHMISMTEW
eukprot:CAMPEP_0201593670 /NCGR_PEP_ID=MMETSP0190_2-20130828/191209_1 /ASSEMBLY_ACC=CAM_ASM_000263 /TAXON_ID=37353 /ORGANISM="Rosalina sp." /LENGTH=239 /DNA_ID=CAMNT_0048052955 /DNA_START=15 /DNA_END=731 /DNA_ORIENTATION=+